ncbi:MAG: acetyl-CoA carboxylase biotin carboxyl carrier protein [Velocimicrobium sp.]
MELENILELIHHVSDSKLTTFMYEENDFSIKMKVGNQEFSSRDGAVLEHSFEKRQSDKTMDCHTVDHTMEKQDEKWVKSPLVGTFYSAPTEEGEAFVKVGDTVKCGQTLGIVEAMKLMNEIESDYDGVVVEILVENMQCVEYGQPLFRME